MNDPVIRFVDSRSPLWLACAFAASSLLIIFPADAKTPQQIFEAASPSIVIVEVHGSAGKLEATGSGVVIATGEVVTNCHVAQEDKTLVVRQGKVSYSARLHYADRERDLCQLAVPNFKARPIALGDVASLKTGARVVAIGAPEGLELSISEGLISALRDYGDGSKIIQTTAPISPGSSGGGLFDESGNLIGFTTFFLKEGQNLNFALPVSWVAQLPHRNVAQAGTKKTSLDLLAGAAALQQKKDWPALSNYAQSWTQEEPQNPLAWAFLGESLNSLGQYPQAIDADREALRINPNFAAAWASLGFTYFKLQQYAQVIEAEREALRIDPKYAPAWADLGAAFAMLRQSAQAIDAEREALRIDPNFSLAWYRLGSAYFQLQQYAQVMEAEREALRIDPNFAPAWFELGLAYGGQGNRNGAIEAYQALRTIDPAVADQLFNAVIAPH